MRILFIITELDSGGAEHALCHVSRLLNRAGHTICVVALSNRGNDLKSFLQSDHIPFFELGLNGVSSLHRGPRLRKIISDFKPDVVNSWLFHANILARLICPSHIPVINSYRVVEPRMSHTMIDRMLRSRRTKALCVSEPVLEFACRKLNFARSDCFLIENGVDSDYFRATVSNNCRTDTICGLSIGRKTFQKGFDILIEGLALLPSHLSWEWTFLGNEDDTSYTASLKKLVCEHRLEGRIKFVAEVERMKMPDYYQEANIVCMPSRWEGMPNVAFESMASGKPLIVSRNCNIPTRFPVMTVKANTAECWAENIAALPNIAHKLARNVATCCDEVKEQSWGNCAQAHMEIYHGTVQKQKT